MDCDLIAIGGGFAGLTVAARASQLGLKAVVLERGTDQVYMCSSRVSTGVFTFLGTDPTADEDEIYSVIMRATDNTAQPEVARLFASNAGHAYRWLTDEGASFVPLPEVAGQLILEPPRRMRYGLDWEGRGPDALMQTLEGNILDRGGTVIRGASAEALVMEDRACVGVEVVTDGEPRAYRSAAVVIADGGFHGNVDMVGEYITRRPDRILVRAPREAVGDGLRMAADAGAELGGFGQFYGHLHHRDAMENNDLWPYPHVDYLAEVAVLVGEDGKRFTDEALGGVVICNAIAQMEDPLTASIVCDDTIWSEAGQETRPVPANPGLFEAGASIHSAPTLTELAEKAGIDAERLTDTVARHNHAIEKGGFDDLDPPRSVNKPGLTSMATLFRTSPEPRPIVNPPYHAIPVCAGLTEPMGGIQINGNAQALRPTGEPIPGLYAAGHVITGLEGGPRTGFFGGYPKAFILGVVAAEHAASMVGMTEQRSA